ncbi:preprotein translocase subunit SecG [Candidatus Babeliales bacterium]|nr:preprotein translocase subunit SecG [Candidatus Babeliales bacterium]
MIGFLTFLYVSVSVFLALFIYIQQGKGDMGLGGLGGGSQTLFGGSGGQNFFEKTTWALGAIFILGALGLSIIKSTYTESKLEGYRATPAAQYPGKNMLPEKAPYPTQEDTQKKENK